MQSLFLTVGAHFLEKLYWKKNFPAAEIVVCMSKIKNAQPSNFTLQETLQESFPENLVSRKAEISRNLTFQLNFPVYEYMYIQYMNSPINKAFLES